MLVGVCCWGITPVLLRRLTPYIDAWTANGLRYPMAAVLYWPLLLVASRRGRLDRALVRRCFVPAMFALGGQVFWSLSYYELPASEIGFLIRLTSAWAVLGSMLLFRDERRLLTRSGFYVGLLLIVGGFLTMSMTPGHNHAEPANLGSASLNQLAPEAAGEVLAAGNHRRGVFFIVLCGAFFGCYMVSVRRFIPDVHPVLSFGVVCNIVSVGTVLGMLIRGDVTSIPAQPPLSWILMVSSSLLGIALGHIVMYTAIHRLGAAIASCCQTLMPFITVTVASIVLHERLSAPQWLGGIVMIAGAFVLLTLKNDISINPNE